MNFEIDFASNYKYIFVVTCQEHLLYIPTSVKKITVTLYFTLMLVLFSLLVVVALRTLFNYGLFF